MKKFRLNREDSLIFIIDIQERLVPAMYLGDRVVKNTDILIQGAREMDMPIVATEQYPKGLGATIEDLRDKLDEENIFEKNSFTACIENVESKLKELNKKNIIIVGMETHVCVYQTVRDLLDRDYNVFVVRDAVASRTLENLENGLNLMQALGAVIINTETVVFDLLKKSGTPEFKLLSKLIK